MFFEWIFKITIILIWVSWNLDISKFPKCSLFAVAAIPPVNATCTSISLHLLSKFDLEVEYFDYCSEYRALKFPNLLFIKMWKP